MHTIQRLSWQEIDTYVQEVASRIQETGFKPDCLVGIAVGGLIPLGLFAKELGVRTVVTVSASSYTRDTQGDLNITYLPKIDLSSKNVLLVDDIADTGETLRCMAGIMNEKYHVRYVMTAVIAFNKGRCGFKPDFFGFENSAWVVFPWERKEFPEYFA